MAEAVPLTKIVRVTRRLVEVRRGALNGAPKVAHPYTLGGGVTSGLGTDLVIERDARAILGAEVGVHVEHAVHVCVARALRGVGVLAALNTSGHSGRPSSSGKAGLPNGTSATTSRLALAQRELWAL